MSDALWRALSVVLIFGMLTGIAVAGSRLPDGGTAKAGGNGVRAAWYEGPTTKYAHGVLGDAIEATVIAARGRNGKEHRLTLPGHQVFEDITPRLADLDGDGGAEIITIRSDVRAGAAVAIYGLRNGALKQIAATSPIGRSNRWLCPAGIADFNGDGRLEIAIVKTPHIGGTLEFLQLRGGRLARLASARGFSNHAIGSRNLREAAIGDVNGDGRVDLVLPDGKRTSVMAVSLNGSARILGVQGLDGRVTGSIKLRGATATVPTSAGNKTVTFR